MFVRTERQSATINTMRMSGDKKRNPDDEKPWDEREIVHGKI